MTHSEATQILATIKAAYPRSYANVKDEEVSELVNLWYDSFRADEYSLVAIALKTYIETDETGFEPNIGKVKAIMRRITQPDRMSAYEAWQIVLKSADDAYYAPAPAFNSLPPLLQKFVGNWETLIDILNADATTLSVMKSDFVKQYNAHYDRVDELEALPSEAKQYRAMLLSENGTAEIKRLGE